MYLAIFHSWHVDSRGFEYQMIDTDNENLASVTAKAKNYELDRPFKKTDFILIELASGIRPRKLTFKERLTGKISAPSFSPPEPVIHNGGTTEKGMEL